MVTSYNRNFQKFSENPIKKFTYRILTLTTYNIFYYIIGFLG